MCENVEISELMAVYNKLRDRQYAAYAKYARRHNLTVNEVFVLYLLWFSSSGQTQKEICEAISVNKQTVNAIVSRFHDSGYIMYTDADDDRRNKRIVLTECGKAYTDGIIPPVAAAEDLAMAELTVEKASKLVELTNTFTEIMERRIAETEAK